MNVVSPPPPQQAELEALIREARARQRRRRMRAAAGFALLAGAVTASWALSGSGSRGSRTATRGVQPAGGAACRPSRLAISFVYRGAAVMGEEGGLLRFTNTGRDVCSVRGWPSVVAVRRSGSRVAASRLVHAPMLFATYWLHGPRVPTLALRPHASGYAIVGGYDNPVGRPPRWRCPAAQRLLVSPPGGHEPVSLSGLLWASRGDRVYLPLCGGKPFVSPIRLRPASLRIPAS